RHCIFCRTLASCGCWYFLRRKSAWTRVSRTHAAQPTVTVFGFALRYQGLLDLCRRRLANDRSEGVDRAILLAILLLLTVSVGAPAEALDINIGYLGTIEKMSTISLLEMPASNAGLAGAQLAIDDNNTTGKFLGQSFALEEIMLNGKDDPT